MAKGKAAGNATADAGWYVHAAVLKLATEGGPRKLQSTVADAGGLFPKGTGQAIKEAIARATTGDGPLLRVAGKEGKAEVYDLTPHGVRAVGPAVEHVAAGLTAADAHRLAERVLAQVPDAAAELVPFLEKLESKRAAEADAAARQRQADAEREEQVRAAMKRWEEGKARSKQARIAELQNELAELGGVAIPAERGPKSPPVPAPKEAKEFIRQEVRRLVSAWSDAIRLGRTDAQLALEVVLGNLSAVRQVGEEGEQAAFDPVHHDSAAATSKGARVRVTLPGWVLVEGEDAEYVVAKARVTPGE